MLRGVKHRVIAEQKPPAGLIIARLQVHTNNLLCFFGEYGGAV